MTETSPILESGERSRNEYISTFESSVLTHSSHSSSKWQQIFATFAATMSAAGLGSVFAYTATAIPDMRVQNSFGEITSGQEAWIGSFGLLGGVLACPVAGFLIDFLGRKKTILWMMVPFVCGWLLIAFAPNLLILKVGRFVTGFCGGSVNLVIPVLLAEVSDVEIRGALTSCLDMMITVGILYIYLIGSYTAWEIQALACSGLPLLCFLLMLFVPESPRFLLQNKQTESARKALSWFRNSNEEEVEEELAELAANVIESQEMPSSWLEILQAPVLRPISIGIMLMFMQQCCGILPIVAFTVDIFNSAGTNIGDNLSTIIVGVIQVVATISSALVVDKCGRRLLLLVSQAFMAVAMGGMGSFFYMKYHSDSKHPFPMDALSWVPLTSLLIFVFSFSIGIGPISWVYMGEILPSNFKGKGSGIITATSWILSFFMTLGFGTLMTALGEDGGYWMFGGVSLLGVFYVYFCVPETNGKTLEEIQSYFR